MKTKKISRLISIVLCVAMICTVAVQGMSFASADSVFENENLVVDPGFETLDLASATSDESGQWFYWQNASRITSDSHGGSYSVAVTNDRSGGSSLEQDITGLRVGVTYVYTIWAKLSAESTTPEIGVKNYGGSEIKVNIDSTEWKQYSIEFTYTSAAQNPRIYVWSDYSSDSVTAYVDDASLTVKSDIARAEISNGQIAVELSDSYTGTPSASDFSANYTTSVDPSSSHALPLSEASADGNSIVLAFGSIAQAAVEQTVTVNLTLGSSTITLDFTVEASGEEEVVGELESVSAENGTLTAVLTENPTVAPTAADFELTADINGVEAALDITGLSYDAQTKTVTISFTPVSGVPDADRNVTVTAVYNGTAKSDSFTVAQGTATTYYVANSGSDSNSGTSADAPFASIDKLNTLTFAPGDRILFKKGDTFVGTFKPQGSGIEGYPIVVSSYGEGDARPVLQPGEAWTIPAIMSANASETNAQVKGCIYLYNVEYWEVRDLELEDPSYDPNFYAVNSLTVYNSGIRVVNENMGDLTHFYFDNLVIHGFRGPGSNLGKTSGGINFNTFIDLNDSSVNVPSALVDMQITNCEIYECGRSGVNFLNPWALRRGTDDKWYATNYGTLEFYPHRDFYMANCNFHDIDGDGLIVDNVSNAVVENNLCYRTAIHLGSMSAAVGFFNWNSDDTYFQFNEVYDIGLNATQNSGALTTPSDAQGIEVDALNDRTWVQYNYVHDNIGGLMMWCNVSSDAYAGFDAIVRYNISENDGTAAGLFNPCGFEYGSEFYNNVIYLSENALNSSGQIYLFSGTSSAGKIKMYNNVFYYGGEEPAAANTFADSAIDWRSNIFFGFTNMPADDESGNPNINADPLFVNPNSGVTGTVPGEICDLSGYKVSSDSPAINAGVPLASMQDETGGRDYFGNKLSGIPDIGVYESGSSILKITSLEYTIDQNAMTVTVDDSVTAAQLLNSLLYDDGIKVGVYRNGIRLVGNVYLADGDIVKASDSDDEIIFTVTVTETEEVNIIPIEYLSITAGSEETDNATATEGPVSYALDDNTGTFWHSSWTGTNRDDLYAVIELNGNYSVNGLTYLPRQDSGSGGTNGIITEYRIEVSSNGTDWEEVSTGEWTDDHELKTVMFEESDTIRYVKLSALDSLSNSTTYVFASAAEIRLLGNALDVEPVVPDKPENASISDVTGSSAKISWEAPADSENVVKYVIKNGEEVLAVVAADTLSFTAGGLEAETEYTFSVYSQSSDGTLSDASQVTFTTLENEYTLGDVDNDGNINAADATLVLQYYANIIDDSYEVFIKEAADVDLNEKIDATDATLILQYYADIISAF